MSDRIFGAYMTSATIWVTGSFGAYVTNSKKSALQVNFFLLNLRVGRNYITMIFLEWGGGGRGS